MICEIVAVALAVLAVRLLIANYLIRRRDVLRRVRRR